MGSSLLWAGCFDPGDPVATGDGSTGSSATESTGPGATSIEDGSTTQTAVDSSGGSDGPPCVDDADCDDGLACNGVETCDARTCVPGNDPCDNPDPEHCAVACEESGEGPVCSVVAADADGDEHGDSACADAPGDDCNDGDDTIFTGAEELCDGLDNDCDDLVDLDDGLELYGTPAIVPDVFFVDLAYSTEDANYAIAYNASVGSRFVSYNLDQTIRATPRDFPADGGPGDRVFLEAVGAGYGGFYRGGGGNTFLRSQPVDADGNIGAATGVTTSGGVEFSYTASELVGGGVGAIWNTSAPAPELRLRLLGDDLAPLGQVVAVPFEGLAPRIHRSGDTFAIGWQENGGGSTRIGFYDNNLSQTATVEVTPSPVGTIYGSFGIGAMGTGFGVAYGGGVATQRVDYVEYEGDGSLRCGPITLADQAQSVFLNMDTDGSNAVVYVSAGSEWILYRVAENCEPIGNGVQIESVTFFGEIGDVDINPSGIGVVSQIFDDGGANSRYSFRALGPNLCDAPVAP